MISMLADFGSALSAACDAWHYRLRHLEAGVLGHALYLEVGVEVSAITPLNICSDRYGTPRSQAEAQGLRGSALGCFFDDEVLRRAHERSPVPAHTGTHTQTNSRIHIQKGHSAGWAA